MSEITTANGVSVVVNIAPFKDAMALKNAIAKELTATGIKLDLKADVSTLSSLALSVDSSDSVYKALFSCLARCTYGGQKIIEATFEDEKAREDYYEVVIECLKVNLSPFFKGLALKLKTLKEILPEKDSPK